MIVIRKSYHFLAVALVLPAILCQPGVAKLALAVAFILLTVLEELRVSQFPCIGKKVRFGLLVVSCVSD